MIHICIETHNRRERLEALLTSEHFQAAVLGSLAHVMVLAQDSEDDTREILGRFSSFPWFTAWNSTQYTSYAGAVQRMIDRLIGGGLEPTDMIVLLNDDIQVLADDWLEKLTAPLKQYDVAASGAVGGFITHEWHTRGAVLGVESPGPVDFVGAGWSAYRALPFLSGVEFDHRFTGCYWEDFDVSMQIKNQGWLVWGCHDVPVWHDGSEGATEQRQQYYAKNRLIAQAKWQGKGLIQIEREANHG